MEYSNTSLNYFTAALYAKTSVPGGGGASAVMGALGAALAGMVINFTAGKKKFACHADFYNSALNDTESLRTEFLALVERDAEVFEPLSRAYSLPTSTPEECDKKAAVMESTLSAAAEVPIKIMQCAARAIAIHAELSQKCSAIVVSDIGVGVCALKAALNAAALNVYINTKAMTDRENANRLNARADELIKTYSAVADDVFSGVLERLK